MLRQIFNSYAFRVTTAYVAGLSLSVFAILVLIYAYHSHAYFDDFGAELARDLAALKTGWRNEGTAGLAAAVAARARALPGDLYYVIADERQTPLASSLPAAAQVVFQSRGWLNFRLETFRLDSLQTRATALAASARLPDGKWLIAAREASNSVRMENVISAMLLRSLMVTLLIGVGTGVVVGTLSLRQLAHVNRSVQRVMAGDLSERIDAGNWHSDVREVTDHFNRLLDRIQMLMTSLRQVSDNIAHDLRTPLTRMRNRLASVQMEAPPELREPLQSVLNEADGLLATFNALLRIAQIESGVRRAGFQRVDFSLIARDVIELYEPLAAEMKINMVGDVTPDCAVDGDRDLLFQMLANLLDNAIKYTPAHGTVSLVLRRPTGAASLVLSDTGPGIAPEHRDKVFRRFFRVEASRNAQPGNGLGLSLVQAVVQLHRGRVRLESNGPGGLRVLLDLPST